MGKSGLAAAIIAAMVGGAPGLALADGTLQLVIGGEGFDGPPKFAVSFDGKPVGDGQVSQAIDTSKAGRFADATDKDKYVQNFSFKIPDSMFRANGEVAIKLTNEEHGPAGSKNDRELFVKSVAVNGEAVPGNQLAMRSAAGIEPTALLGGYLVVSQGAVEGIATAPGRGWPMVGVASATPVDAAPAQKPAPGVATAAEPAGKPAAPSPVVAPVQLADAVPPPATSPKQPSAKPAPAVPAPEPAIKVAAIAPSTEPTAKVAEAAPAPEPAVKVTEAAPSSESVAPTPEVKPQPVAARSEPAPVPAAPPVRQASATSCGLNQRFQVLGFNENSNDLTPRTRKALDAVVKAIGSQKCVVHLTGYSSTEGDYAHNALFSIERAQNALHYLVAQGVKFDHYSANGVGETTQFGRDPNANRRVVVTVSP